MYRPEGWENPFTVEHMNLSLDAETETNIYEAGANAMLEGLEKLSFIGEDLMPLDIEGRYLILFIPKEE